MDGLGRRLRERAKELGLSDAEVARRAGLTPTRSGHYVSDYREPDLGTLVRISGVLGITPNEVLASPEAPGDDALSARRRAVAGYADAMDAATLDVAVAVMRALAVSAVRQDGPAPPRPDQQVGKRAPGREKRARKDS